MRLGSQAEITENRVGYTGNSQLRLWGPRKRHCKKSNKTQFHTLEILNHWLILFIFPPDVPVQNSRPSSSENTRNPKMRSSENDAGDIHDAFSPHTENHGLKTV